MRSNTKSLASATTTSFARYYNQSLSGSDRYTMNIDLNSMDYNLGDGNVTISPVSLTNNISTKPGPITISQIQHFWQGNALYITWKTSEPATSVINYAPQISDTVNSLSLSQLVTDHEVIVPSSLIQLGWVYQTKSINADSETVFSEWRIIDSIKNNTSSPAVPLLYQPIDGSIKQPTSLTLNWGHSDSATAYHIQVSSDSSFSSNEILDDSSVTDTFKLCSGLFVDSTYYWHVSAINAYGASPYSASWKFTTAVQTSCVWPGDCDNNGIVNSADILPIGLFYGQTFQKNNPGIIWQCYQRMNWTQDGQTPRRTYADANGDSIINSADILPVGLNYGKSHSSNAERVAFVTPSLTQQFDGSIKIERVSPVVTSEGDVNVVLRLETHRPIFGISFKMKYRYENLAFGEKKEDKFLVRSVSVDTISGILGTTLEFVSAQDSKGYMDIGLTRYQGEGIVGSGKLIQIKLNCSSTMNGVSALRLEIVDIIANDQAGSAIEIEGAKWTGFATTVDPDQTPSQYSLSQNYPNPFNPVTLIQFGLPEAAFTTLKIYNILGEEVATLVQELRPSGNYTVQWDARQYPSGIYTYKLSAGKYMNIRKMLLIK